MLRKLKKTKILLSSGPGTKEQQRFFAALFKSENTFRPSEDLLGGRDVSNKVSLKPHPRYFK